MTSQSRACIVVCVAASSAVGAAVANTIVYGPNLASGSYTLVPNGNFESGMAGWSSGGPGNFQASTNSIIGTYSAVTNTLSSDGFNTPGYATEEVVGLIQGNTYFLSAFFNRGTLAGGQLYVDLNDVAGEPNLLMDIGDARTQFVYASFVAQSSSVTVRLVRDSTRVVGESGYIDNVAITAASDFHAAVVPLPPAALAGIGSLAGVAGLGVIRRRRMARV